MIKIAKQASIIGNKILVIYAVAAARIFSWPGQK
jgi:hypothetical protein